VNIQLFEKDIISAVMTVPVPMLLENSQTEKKVEEKDNQEEKENEEKENQEEKEVNIHKKKKTKMKNKTMTSILNTLRNDFNFY